MTRQKLCTVALVALTTFAVQLPACSQTSDTAAKHDKKHKETPEQQEIRELHEALKAQQEEIDALKAQMAGKDQQAATAQQSAADASAQAAAAKQQADTATAAATEASTKVDAVSSSVNDLKTTTTGLAETAVANQQHVQEAIESPVAIHYKGITLTPVAFFAFEGVWRERSVNSDINTPFNSIPFPSANEGHTSELNFSGRQSRLGGLFEGNAGAYKLSGYFEGDFLGTGTSSNNNQSNSYVLRQRQFWGKAETKSGFAVTGGQMWSLVTEDGKSTDTRTEKLPNTIDAQYMVGFSWARQPAIRLQQRFGDVKTGMLTTALSLEQAQITNFTVNNAGNAPANFYFAGVGQNGGLYNAAGNVGAGNVAGTGAITTYANNTAPDLIIKAAYDLPKAHFELGGIARFMRDFYFAPTYSTATSTYTYGTNYLSNTKTGGGLFGSARVTTSKYLDLAVQAMAGQGLGRYGSAQLADATLRPDSTLEPIRNYHGMFSIESHPAPKLDVFAYYGGEYAQRTVYANANGGLFGYGPASVSNAGCYNLPVAPPSTGGSGGSLGAVACGSPTRYIQEGMLGFTYRVVNTPKYGRLQYSMTYQYFQRNLWSGVGSATTPTGPRAEDSMIHVGMRYYIP